MSDITAEDIHSAIHMSKLRDYSGKFRELGGGEVNDTFVLDCGDQKVVFRFSRYPGNNTLRHEAQALSLMNIPNIPRLIFFDISASIKGKLWIAESYVPGHSVSSLTINQYRTLGGLLAQVHKVHAPVQSNVNLWEHFLYASSHFGDEHTLLHHPDSSLKDLVHRAQSYFGQQTALFENVEKSLVHGDATPNNVLVEDDRVSLIDWEFSKFEDPMLDFSTIYYDDMEYNRGKWRPHISSAAKSALFEGYEAGGGSIDEERIQVWMNLDKLGAATYLYWKMYESGHTMEEDQVAQYRTDFQSLIESLQRNLP